MEADELAIDRRRREQLATVESVGARESLAADLLAKEVELVVGALGAEDARRNLEEERTRADAAAVPPKPVVAGERGQTEVASEAQLGNAESGVCEQGTDERTGACVRRGRVTEPREAEWLMRPARHATHARLTPNLPKQVAGVPSRRAGEVLPSMFDDDCLPDDVLATLHWNQHDSSQAEGGSASPNAVSMSI